MDIFVFGLLVLIYGVVSMIDSIKTFRTWKVVNVMLVAQTCLSCMMIAGGIEVIVRALI